MPSPSQENLPAEIELALAYTPAAQRPALRIFFELDARLGRIVAGTNEAMLGQMRLAWWRETLAKPVAERPSGDQVLNAIGEHWVGKEADLIKLVDGWERLFGQIQIVGSAVGSLVGLSLGGLRVGDNVGGAVGMAVVGAIE